MLLSSLAVQLSSKEAIAPALAFAWAWRVQNEYPEGLRKVAEAWADNDSIPAFEISGISLDQVLHQSGVSVPEALELMYVLSKSPTEGRTILARCTRRDQLY